MAQLVRAELLEMVRSRTSAEPALAEYANGCVNVISSSHGDGVWKPVDGRFTAPVNTVVTLRPSLATKVLLAVAGGSGPTESFATTWQVVAVLLRLGELREPSAT